jgi:hypothetical protein
MRHAPCSAPEPVRFIALRSQAGAERMRETSPEETALGLLMEAHMAKRSSGKPGSRKIGKVMGEYKRGTLRSSSGSKVRKRKQAVAIALSEARRSGAPVPPKPGGRRPRRATAGRAR